MWKSIGGRIGCGIVLAALACLCVSCEDDGGGDSAPVNVTGAWVYPTLNIRLDLGQTNERVTGTETASGQTHRLEGYIFDGNGITFTSYYSDGTKTYSGRVDGNEMHLKVIYALYNGQGGTFENTFIRL